MAAPRPTGSAAAQAFADALDTLRTFAPSSPSRPPAYTVSAAEGIAVGAPEAALPASSASGHAHWGSDTLAASARRVAARQVSSVELVDAAIAAAERFDEPLNALAHREFDAALHQAKLLDEELASGTWRGPLHGLPITVKDVIDVAGQPTRCGSLAYEAHPSVDAIGVARLRAAGAIVLGKATTHEFALGVTTPQARNPVDPTRIPGGSSGGSAICAATGIGFASLGTDTRASIRVPAALSGVVGFKPTLGRIPTTGVVPLSWTMDHVAPIGRTVLDSALMLDALFGLPGVVAAATDDAPAGLRVGVPAAGFTGAIAEVEATVRAAIARLGELGVSVREVERPSDADFDASNAAGMIVSRCEAATFHRTLQLDRSRYWDEVAEQLALAEGLSAMDYIEAQRWRADLMVELRSCFDEVDVLALPTALVVAPPVEDFARYLYVLSRNAILFSFVGFPALSVPCGVTPEGLPVGLQLVAAPGAEATLACLGHAIEHQLATA